MVEQAPIYLKYHNFVVQGFYDPAAACWYCQVWRDGQSLNLSDPDADERQTLYEEGYFTTARAALVDALIYCDNQGAG